MGSILPTKSGGKSRSPCSSGSQQTAYQLSPFKCMIMTSTFSIGATCLAAMKPHCSTSCQFRNSTIIGKPYLNYDATLLLCSQFSISQPFLFFYHHCSHKRALFLTLQFLPSPPPPCFTPP